MQVDITIDGVTTTEDADLDVGQMSLRQAVQLEKVLGESRVAKLFAGDTSVAALPTTIQAMLFVQLSAQFPGLTIDGFDFDLSALGDDVAEDDADVVELSMTLPDGSEVEGASEHADPTQETATG